jgi:hypothetical protein
LFKAREERRRRRERGIGEEGSRREGGDKWKGEGRGEEERGNTLGFKS